VTQAICSKNVRTGFDAEQPDLLAERLIWPEEEDAKVITEVVAESRKVPLAVNRIEISLWQRSRHAQAALGFGSPR